MGEEAFISLCKAVDVAAALRVMSTRQLRKLMRWLATQSPGEIKDEITAACSVEVADRFTEGKI